jgi:autotransporter-associated beta strand protein
MNHRPDPPRGPRTRSTRVRTDTGRLHCDRPLAVCVLAGSLALVALPAGAAVYHWVGASANWSTAGNWTEGLPPKDGTAFLYFDDNPAATVHNTVINTLGWAIDGLALRDDDPYVVSGNPLEVGLNGILAFDPLGKVGADHAIMSDVTLGGLVGIDQIWTNASTGTLTVGGTVTLNGHQLQVVAAPGDYHFTGAITGPGSLTKLGAGTLTLSGANNYSGPTAVKEGTLSAGANNVIPAGTFTLDAGLLDLTGHSETIGPGAVSADGLVIGGGPGAQAMVLSPTSPMFISTLGTFVHCLGAIPSEIAGKLELATSNGTRTFDVADNPALDQELVVSADVTNSLGVAGSAPAIVKTGLGTMRLTGANTFIRTVQVLQGSLVVANDDALGAGGASNATLVVGGQLQLAAGTDYVGETLNLSGVRTDGALRALAGTSRWGGRVETTGSASIYVEAGDLSIHDILPGGSTLFKRGPGQLRFETALPASAPTYSIDVVDGEMQATGSPGALLPGGSVFVRAGARLSGVAQLPQNQLRVDPGGTVAPGAPIGELQVQDLIMTGGTLEIELSAADPTGVHDQLRARSVELAGTLHVISPVPLSLGQEFTILTYSKGHSGAFTHMDLPSLAPGLGWFAENRLGALVLSIQAAAAGVEPRTPSRTALLAPAPNPATRGASLRYELSHAGRVTVAIFDAQGRRVSTPLDGMQQDAGPHAIDWDRREEAGGLVAAGNYVVRLWLDGRAVGSGRKLTLVR